MLGVKAIGIGFPSEGGPGSLFSLHGADFGHAGGELLLQRKWRNGDSALLAGLKARHVTAWGEAPGKRPQTNLSALKGRDMGGADFVSAFQALGDFV